MAHGQATTPEILLDGLGQPEQSESVGDGRAVLPKTAGQLLLSPSELRQQPLISLCGFHGVEVLPKEVLDQAKLERLGVARLADDCRYPCQARLLSRAPTTLTDEDLVLTAPGSHHQWLKHPGRADRSRELFERLTIEASARLLWIRD